MTDAVDAPNYVLAIVAAGELSPEELGELLCKVNAGTDNTWFLSVRDAAQAADRIRATRWKLHVTVRCEGVLVAHAGLAEPASDAGHDGSFTPPPGYLEVKKLMVAPEHQNQGLALLVLGHVEQAALSVGCVGIYGYALDNVVDMYLRLGGTVTGHSTAETTGRRTTVFARALPVDDSAT